MAVKSLAIKYRPQTFDDVTEQGAIKVILTQQLESGETKNAYLFCGGAGTGKTTCARIFANEINKHQGNPIEMDAASNNSVEDAREMINQAKTKSLDSEYKVFIVDECHMLSTAAWNALLKLIEEPPAKSIFIFCTTDPQKIPKTILSRVQRYDFQRISQDGIAHRLHDICMMEDLKNPLPDADAIEYIAKIADGGMRDAITLMDKCLAYNTNLTLDNVVKAIGVIDYYTMFNLNNCIFDGDSAGVLEIVETVHKEGMDLKQFIKSYTNFVLDVCKYNVTKSFEYLEIPATHKDEISKYGQFEFSRCKALLRSLIQLNADIKWETSPKSIIEATLMLECEVKE